MKALLEKYFDGETSLEEEAQLRAYFNSEAVDDELKMYQPLFQHFTQEHEQALPDDFDERLFQQLEPAEAKVVKMRTWPRQLLRIAAVGAVLLVAMVAIWKPNPTQPLQASIDWSKYEITDEQKAYEETVKALRLVSSKLNKGKHKASEEMEKMEKVGKYLN
ncbi:MAG: hypothetical protein IT258_17890 [Saprospiraceae bacterium]|nr:hypothetical protein [Saprospiraceae bacterium]